MATSDSDHRIVDVEASVEIVGDPVAALSSALDQVLGKLVGAGAAPAHLIAMIWSAAEPAAIHPSRRAVDRAWREIFAGFRPPLTVHRVDGTAVRVHARARVPAAPSAAPVWRGYDVAEVGRQMSPRGQVKDMAALFAMWTRDGAAARAGRHGLDLAYGPHRDQRLDLYRPAGVERPPVWVFIHGGYWQASSKDQHAQFCTGMLEAGFACANIDYGLAPETPLATIVDHVREALMFLAREADALAIDATRMHVAGHSAGGHLAAFMAADARAPQLRSAHILSGVVDLEPLTHIAMGRILGVTSAQHVKALSPVGMKLRPGTRIAVAVGGNESAEFHRQGAEIARSWNAPPPLVVPGENHFSLLEGLRGGALLDQARELCRG